MRLNIIATSLLIATGIALSIAASPAQAASTCNDMFAKAEKMVASKGTVDVGKKVKGYQMAIDGYNTCAKALAMANGAARDTMMKKAENDFGAAYDYINSLE